MFCDFPAKRKDYFGDSECSDDAASESDVASDCEPVRDAIVQPRPPTQPGSDPAPPEPDHSTDPVPAGPAGAEAAPPAAPIPHRSRTKRAIAWGKFELAPIFRDAVQVGWGATCGRHCDAGSAVVCKKQLGYKGRKRLDIVLSQAECLAKVKRWLVQGCAIGSDDPLAQTTHVKIDARYLEASGPDEDLTNPPELGESST